MRETLRSILDTVRRFHTYHPNRFWLAAALVVFLVILAIVLIVMACRKKKRGGSVTDQLYREIDLLRRENQQLRQQLIALQGGEAGPAPGGAAQQIREIPLPVTEQPEKPVLAPSGGLDRAYGFFARRSLALLLAAVLGFAAFWGFSYIMNGHVGAANQASSGIQAETAAFGTPEYSRQAEANSQAISAALTGGLAAVALAPAMFLCLGGTLFCLIGWLFRQRWAAILAGVLFAVALAFALTRFYLPLVPMILSFVGAGRLKRMKQNGGAVDFAQIGQGKKWGLVLAVPLLLCAMIAEPIVSVSLSEKFFGGEGQGSAVSATQKPMAVSSVTDPGGRAAVAAATQEPLAAAASTQQPLAVSATAKPDAAPTVSMEVKQADKIYSYSHGLAEYVTVSGKNGIIDAQGLIVVPAGSYDDYDVLSDGYICVEKNGKRGLLDPKGKAVLPCSYDYVSVSGEAGLWRAEIRDSGVTLMNAAGEKVAPAGSASYIFLGEFSEGLACARTADGVQYIDPRGAAAFTVPNASRGSAFLNGKAWAFVPDGDRLLIKTFDRTGRELSSFAWNSKVYKDPQYDPETDTFYAPGRYSLPTVYGVMDAGTGAFHDTFFKVYSGSSEFSSLYNEGEVNVASEGKVVINALEHLNPGEVVPKYLNSYCYLDLKLKSVLIFPKERNRMWYSASEFRDGCAIVRTCGVSTTPGQAGFMDPEKVGYYGVINDSGNYVIQPTYDSIGRMDGSCFKVKADGKWGIYDAAANRFVYRMTADSIGALRDGRILVKASGYYGYLDAQYTTALALKYEDATSFDPDSHLALVKLDGVWHAINRSGSYVW